MEKSKAYTSPSFRPCGSAARSMHLPSLLAGWLALHVLSFPEVLTTLVRHLHALQIADHRLGGHPPCFCAPRHAACTYFAAPPLAPLRCRAHRRGPGPAPVPNRVGGGSTSADASLFHVSLDLSAHRGLLASHATAGQFLPFRLPASPYPIFLAIASPPPPPAPEALAAVAGPASCFEFLVKRLPGTPSARLCDLRPGDLVHVGASVVGSGFDVARIADARDVLVFATGSGISPIRSLIESGFAENKRTGVSLFYGVRNLQRMAYQERFDDWESRGVKIVPVLSRPDGQWTDERGYVQNVFSRMKNIVNPSSVGAILCGHKQMTEEITRVLVADGLSKDRILTNF